MTKVTFNNYQYTRPDVEQMRKKMQTLLNEFSKADSKDKQNQLIAAINEHRSEFDSMWNLAHIRHTIDTNDEAYEKENDFFNDNLPKFQLIINEYYKCLVNSDYKDELKGYWGQQLFRIAEMTSKTVSDEIVDDLALENKLGSDYGKLCASAKIDFEGKEYNLAGLQPFMQSNDRAVREKAYKAFWNFFAENMEQFDEIYDKQVKVRHAMATKLGYKNFVEMGYDRMLRSDYRREQVAQFRDAVLKYIVPFATELRKRQVKRIGVDRLKAYDVGYHFKTGNPTPKGSPEWIVQKGKKMYNELSPETGNFFSFMLDRDLLDLVNKKGKAGGGYCTYISKEKSPFIFSNFNGTSHDIDVLTHEAGHAFQVFESRNYELPEYNWPTYEACEIHSMSMEFFTWPWMDEFFENDTTKYKYSHLASAILFIPYGVCVDEFQHWVYDNPEASAEERRAAWSDLEKKYLPHLDYDGIPYLENGGMWQKQGHIFQMPFYYIDYTLAQICAVQFWAKAQENKEASFEDYLRLCRAGGTRSFLELVDFANLESPFKHETIKNAVESIKTYLDNIDDLKL